MSWNFKMFISQLRLAQVLVHVVLLFLVLLDTKKWMVLLFLVKKYSTWISWLSLVRLDLLFIGTDNIQVLLLKIEKYIVSNLHSVKLWVGKMSSLLTTTRTTTGTMRQIITRKHIHKAIGVVGG